MDKQKDFTDAGAKTLDTMTPEEAKDWMMNLYTELSVVHEDGMTFAGKTAQLVAYERGLESAKPEGERLFNDPCAKYLAGAYGKDCSECMKVALKVHFDPTDEIGFGYNGHIRYTAARTQLINDKMNEWIEKTQGDKQVTNMGAGCDSRVFWLEGMKNVLNYVEVDTEPVNKAKQQILDEIKSKGEIGEPLCNRKVIGLDFAVESTKDMPVHGYDASLLTCWVLEGLVMYLKVEEVVKLLNELSGLSV